MEATTSIKNGILFDSKDKISEEAKAKFESLMSSKLKRLEKIKDDFKNGILKPAKQ